VLSAIILLIVLAIVVFACAGLVMAVSHLFPQPGSGPSIGPTHTALPTSTPTQSS
jgi:hypothetical protein